MRRPGTTLEDVTRAPELPKAKEEMLQQGMGLPDERNEAKEALLPQGTEMEDVTSNPQPHLIKEETVDFTSRPHLEEKEPQEALHVPLINKGRARRQSGTVAQGGASSHAHPRGMSRESKRKRSTRRRSPKRKSRGPRRRPPADPRFFHWARGPDPSLNTRPP